MRIILRDGRVAELREPDVSTADRERIRALFDQASKNSLYFRFFHVVSEIRDAELDRMIRVMPGQSYALVCDAGDRFLGIGNYVVTDHGQAEVAFFVDDRAQGRGLGTLLLEHLADHAWREGLSRFVAYVLNDNTQMLGVFRSSGFAVAQHWSDGVMEMTLPLGATERQKSLMALREKLATAASLAPFFRPATVAVVGASRDDERLGHQVLKHIVDGNFQGTVYPVNRRAQSIYAIRAYARLSDIPEPIDLAVLVVPSTELLAVVNDAIYAGVRGVVITSSGLSDAGPQGRALEATIVAKLRHAGIRLVGPSSMGIALTEPAISLNASFSGEMPRRGKLAVASHSGALGVAILHYASRLGLGISSFVSLGNKPDVSVNDLLQYWEDDPETEAIMLYMESFGNPRKFSQIARRLTRRKPILAVKSARTRPSGDSASAVSVPWDANDAPVDALFRQSGIIRADTLEELFDAAAIITSQPVLTGSRIGLVTNSAAGTVLVEDAAHTLGLTLGTVVDVGYEHLSQGYDTAIRTLLAGPDVDVVLILFVPVAEQDTAPVLDVIRRTAAQYFDAQPEPIPIVANILLAEPTAERFIGAGSRRIPVFSFPETALRALARVRDYGQFVAQPPGVAVDVADADVVGAREIIRELSGAHGVRELSRDSMQPIWNAMGIQIAWEGDAGPMGLALVSDPLFGPILGVKSADGETRIRLVPLTDQDVRQLVPSVIRDSVAEASWMDLLIRLSRLYEESPEVQRIEISGIRVEGTRILAPGAVMVIKNEVL